MGIECCSKPEFGREELSVVVMDGWAIGAEYCLG